MEKKFYLPLTKKRLEEELGKSYRSNLGSDYLVVVVDGGIKYVLGTVSDSYVQVQNSYIFPQAERTLKELNIEVVKRFFVRDYANYFGEFICQNTETFSLKKRVVRPSIMIIHSYIGRFKSQINFGFNFGQFGVYGFDKSEFLNLNKEGGITNSLPQEEIEERVKVMVHENLVKYINSYEAIYSAYLNLDNQFLDSREFDSYSHSLVETLRIPLKIFRVLDFKKYLQQSPFVITKLDIYLELVEAIYMSKSAMSDITRLKYDKAIFDYLNNNN